MTLGKKTIAILGGTGQLGPGLALRWAHAGHRVIIGSRQAEKAEGVAAELNAELGNASIEGMQNADAAKAADLCVLTVEQHAHQVALESVKGALAGKILVDTTARISFPDLTPPTPPAAAQIAQQLLGKAAPVVAAFQTVPAASLRKDYKEPIDSHVLVCSDDIEAAETVMALARDAGLLAYYAGTLDQAIVIEGLTSVLVSMNKHYKSRHGTFKVAGISTKKNS
ncbi:MAG: NADPH-dependent F420 reductase [Anaerolineales bacterium]